MFDISFKTIFPSLLHIRKLINFNAYEGEDECGIDIATNHNHIKSKLRLRNHTQTRKFKA